MPKPLGDRVYETHRTMIKRMAKKLKVSKARVVRDAIEEKHSRTMGI